MGELFKKLKDYLPQIALVPLILGGCWQIFALGTISPSYLRFFSVSQQLADGLVILFILAIFAALFGLLWYIIRSQTSSTEWGEISKISLLVRAIIALAFGVIVSLFTYSKYIDGVMFNINTSLGDILNLIFFGALSLYLIYCFFYFSIILYKKLEWPIPFLPSWLKKVILYLVAWIGSYAFLSSVIGFLVLLSVFHRKYSIPENLSNINYMLDKYCEETPNAIRDSLSVLYMNDKYIFVKNQSNVEVLKFDKFFREGK